MAEHAYYAPLPNGWKDYGADPFVTDINKVTLANSDYRTTLWTGKDLQLTLMNIPAGGDIGLEVHPENDQFLRVENGRGMAMMGSQRDALNYTQPVNEDSAVFVPAGTWHNVVNTGYNPLQLYAIYAPPHHPYGTVHQTKAQADAQED